MKRKDINMNYINIEIDGLKKVRGWRKGEAARFRALPKKRQETFLKEWITMYYRDNISLEKISEIYGFEKWLIEYLLKKNYETEQIKEWKVLESSICEVDPD